MPEGDHRQGLRRLTISGWRYENWDSEDGEPPVILNPRASLHKRISWCHGEANEALQLIYQAQRHSEDIGVLVDAVCSRLMSLERMLSHLGERTSSGSVEDAA